MTTPTSAPFLCANCGQTIPPNPLPHIEGCNCGWWKCLACLHVNDGTGRTYPTERKKKS